MQCGIIIFSKIPLSSTWGEDIFLIHLERKDVDFYVGFSWMRIGLNGRYCEKSDKTSVLIEADCYKTCAWSTNVCKELL